MFYGTKLKKDLENAISLIFVALSENWLTNGSNVFIIDENAPDAVTENCLIDFIFN